MAQTKYPPDGVQGVEGGVRSWSSNDIAIEVSELENPEPWSAISIPPGPELGMPVIAGSVTVNVETAVLPDASDAVRVYSPGETEGTVTMQLPVPPEAGHDVVVPPKVTETDESVDGNPEAETDTGAPAGPDVGERVMDRLGEVTVKVVVATPRLGSVTVRV